jgi:tetratricopeptide (TPR) repeat protein
MLERSAGLDGKYAPTWLALGLRYYFESQYSSGGEENFKRSNAACERALALDPNLTFAASQLITNRVERGELAKAYEQARSLLKRRPESALAHFTLAYVDRYSGMLLDSTRECEVAKKLDPGNFYYRSCMWAFLYLGQPTKAREFVALDAGSEWANWVMPSILLREGKINEAREAARRMPTGTRYERELTEAALHTMRLAIDQNYCALSALENDPLLSPSRPTAEFAELLKAARSCQQPVMAEAGQSQ